MATLLCHIVWMPHYAGEDDVYPSEFDYVREEGYGHELYNFKAFDDICYGYVQARFGTVNVSRLGADDNETFVDGVTIIWTATSPEGKRVIVGWHRNATVFRTIQTGRIRGREFQGKRVDYFTRAQAADTFLVPALQRDFLVPHGGKGRPGQSSVFYPEQSETLELHEWLASALEYISGLTGGAARGRMAPGRGGWSSGPDAAHNAAVEAAAIACVRARLGEEIRDRQKDNCGWDLEFAGARSTICVEVKGLSGTAVVVEVTPNEYDAMRRAVGNTFPEGDYRLAIVINALTAPELLLFAHAGGNDWVCELTFRSIRLTERVAARLSE